MNDMLERALYGASYVILGFSVGSTWAGLRRDKADRERVPPSSPEPEHRCLGTVIRCSPFEQVETLGDTRFSDKPATRTVQGTNVLMKCDCGRWWVSWLPGTWTPEDFKRTTAPDMDTAIAALTRGEKP